MFNITTRQPKNSDRIFLARGKHHGVWTWHYVKVSSLKQPLFLKAIQSGGMDIVDYGEILFSGWGKEPPEAIISQIKTMAA